MVHRRLLLRRLLPKLLGRGDGASDVMERKVVEDIGKS
jgi:hypothetical protein